MWTTLHCIALYCFKILGWNSILDNLWCWMLSLHYTDHKPRTLLRITESLLSCTWLFTLSSYNVAYRVALHLTLHIHMTSMPNESYWSHCLKVPKERLMWQFTPMQLCMCVNVCSVLLLVIGFLISTSTIPLMACCEAGKLDCSYRIV